MKLCAKCGIKKEFCAFYKRNKTGEKLRAVCIQCVSVSPESRKRSKEPWTREKANISSRKYHAKNAEKISIKRKLNKKPYDKEFYRKNPKERLKKNLRNRFLRALKKSYKNGSAVNDLGCSIEIFKTYLESLFLPHMSWENYGFGCGKWNIDHIIPLSQVDLSDEKSLLAVCHYTNLRPMWQIDNLKKGNKLMNLKDEILVDLMKYTREEAYLTREEKQKILFDLVDKYRDHKEKEVTLDQYDLAKISSDAKHIMSTMSLPVYLNKIAVEENDLPMLCLSEATIQHLNSKGVLTKLPRFSK